MATARVLRRRFLSAGCTFGACFLMLACGHSNNPTTARPATRGTPTAREAKEPASAREDDMQARGAVPAPTGSSVATPRPVCPLISAAEMAAILEASIGKPAEDDSPGKTSCIYPPADAGSYEQANIEIQWDQGSEPSPEQQLAQEFGGSAPGQEVSHKSVLGDESTYGIDGVLSIRTGKALIKIELPMRPDSEDKAVAIGKLLLNRLNVTAPRAATTPRATVATETPKFPEGLHVADSCPEVTDDAREAESALVPLKVGLTLSNIWDGGDDNYDHECLVQVIAVTPSYVDVTHSCPRGADHHNVTNKRRICRGDFRDSYFYRTETSNKAPLVVTPATMFSLSTRSLRELKTVGATRHRYIEIAEDWRARAQPMDMDVDTKLRSARSDREPYKIIVNGRQVELPTVSSQAHGRNDELINAKILDDERFPLVLAYEIPRSGLKIQYTKISYPGGEMEKHLAIDKRVDVYGIFFDFASDKLRAESTPVLAEIATVLSKNGDWKLSIKGHTDNVGGDASNLELSRKRATAVKTTLVERYGIAANRLTTEGFGASRPQASNDTAEGRARNRRVELTRP